VRHVPERLSKRRALGGCERPMSEFDDRTLANMDVVLEEVCRELRYGGDHECRKFVAERLMEAARAGQTTLGSLMVIGRRALLELSKRHSAPR
jgi:hypothetical protein